MNRLVLALLVAAGGCRGFGAPPPALLAALPPPDHTGVRAQATVEIDSDALRGTFDALLLADRGPRPRVRLQLFPDLGGTVLDVTATPERITGGFPGADSVDAAPGAAARHGVVFLGLTLLEQLAPLTPERVTGARAIDDGWLVRVAPVWPGLDVEARVSRTGAVRERRYAYRGVRWVERRDGEAFVVTAPGFSFRASAPRVETLAALPKGVFGP